MSKDTTTSVDFLEVDTKLRAYCKATCADMGKLVRRAVSEHIDAELAGNPGTRVRFEKEMAVLRSEAGWNIASIVSNRRPKRTKSITTAASDAAAKSEG